MARYSLGLSTTNTSANKPQIGSTLVLWNIDGTAGSVNVHLVIKE